jgi:transcriptional regulator with XRE-family HTH domain
MQLADYLSANSISPRDFAKSIGVSKETVRRYISGERRPDLENMQTIAKATNGEVTANDFFGIAA